MTSSAKTNAMNSFSGRNTAAVALLGAVVPSCLEWHLGTIGADKRQPGYAAEALAGEFMS
jgi:hypothetical protein